MLNRKMIMVSGAIVAVTVSLAQAQAQDAAMGFFVTSVGVGQGGNFGGLEGADAHCGKLAAAAG
jgi:hypothetical protein